MDYIRFRARVPSILLPAVLFFSVAGNAATPAASASTDSGKVDNPSVQAMLEIGEKALRRPLQDARCIQVFALTDDDNPVSKKLQPLLQHDAEAAFDEAGIRRDCPWNVPRQVADGELSLSELLTRAAHDLEIEFSTLPSESLVGFQIDLKFKQLVLPVEGRAGQIREAKDGSVLGVVFRSLKLDDASYRAEDRFALSLDRLATWSTGTYGFVGRSNNVTETIREAASDLVQDFVRDWALAQKDYVERLRDALLERIDELRHEPDSE